MNKLFSIGLILTLTAINFGQTSKPEVSAKIFFKAWISQNKSQIKAYSTPEVAKMALLKSPPNPAKRYKFESCVWERMENSWYCVWRSEITEQETIEMLLQKRQGRLRVTLIELQ